MNDIFTHELRPFRGERIVGFLTVGDDDDVLSNCSVDTCNVQGHCLQKKKYKKNKNKSTTDTETVEIAVPVFLIFGYELNPSDRVCFCVFVFLSS